MRALESFYSIALLVAAFVFTAAGTWLYRALALRYGIVANPNYRSLHDRPIPRGGGIVFATGCVFVFVVLWWTGAIDAGLARLLIVGGSAATVFGFVDDAAQIRPLVKLGVHGMLAAWTMVCMGGRSWLDIPFVPNLLALGLSWFGLVWMINLYNFMDGIDGMASSGAVIISLAAMLVLYISGAPGGYLLAFAAIAVCNLAFLLFNWPPSAIFMGDAGSVFLGFTFGALLASTVSVAGISVWTWVILFGYFGVDTTTTTLLRIVIADKWYGGHRSHAYQNLARIRGSHLTVVRGVIVYQVLWLLPLAAWSAATPSMAVWAAILGVTPVVVWTFRYGPPLSSL